MSERGHAFLFSLARPLLTRLFENLRQRAVQSGEAPMTGASLRTAASRGRSSWPYPAVTMANLANNGLKQQKKKL